MSVPTVTPASWRSGKRCAAISLIVRYATPDDPSARVAASAGPRAKNFLRLTRPREGTHGGGGGYQPEGKKRTPHPLTKVPSHADKRGRRLLKSAAGRFLRPAAVLHFT